MGSIGPIWIGAVVAALISALVTAFGWWVSHARDRAADERRRREKVVDVQQALRAEIRSHLLQIEEDALETQLPRLLERMRQDPGYRPVPPREKHDTVFAALVEQIDILPTEAIEPVVIYYEQVAALTAFIDDLRVGPLKDLPQERLAGAFEDLVAMKLKALAKGRAAIGALDAGMARARDPARWAWISTRAAARAAPRPAGRGRAKASSNRP